MTDMIRLICCQCKRPMSIPEELHTAARASEKIIFFCAYGHEQHYPKQESEEHKIRRERDRYLQQLSERDDRIREMNKELHAVKEERTKLMYAGRKLKARISKGVCPCCNRTFSDMSRHMQTKHPEYVQ